MDRDDLLIWDARDLKGHSRKLKNRAWRRIIEKNSFSQRNVKAWNNLEEMVHAKTTRELKQIQIWDSMSITLFPVCHS